MHLSDNDSRHMCIKTFTKQDLDIPGYQFVIHENMNFAEYKMLRKGAAGKAFSAYMTIYIAFFRLKRKDIIQRSLLRTIQILTERYNCFRA
jgi:predicted Ser/Thr protein kinase